MSAGWFPGIVCNTADPEKAGRVQAIIPDLFTDPETGEVVESPWIEASGGLGPGYGCLNVPPVGAPIQVERQYDSDSRLYLFSYRLGRIARDGTGDSNSPAVGKGEDDETASALKSGSAFSIPSKAAAVADRFGSPSLTMAETEIPGFPGTTNAGEYPHNRVFKTPGGIVVELDDTPNASRIHLWHPSGAHLEISNDGVRVDQQATRWERTNGNRTTHVGDDDRTAIDGAALTRVAGDDLRNVGGRSFLEAAAIAQKAKGSVLIEAGGRGTFRATEDIEVRSANQTRFIAGGTLSSSAGGDDIGFAGGKFSRVAGEGAAISVPTGRTVEIGDALLGPAAPTDSVAKTIPLAAVLGTLQTYIGALTAAFTAAGVAATEAGEVPLAVAFEGVVAATSVPLASYIAADLAAQTAMPTRTLKAW